MREGCSVRNGGVDLTRKERIWKVVEFDLDVGGHKMSENLLGKYGERNATYFFIKRKF